MSQQKGFIKGVSSCYLLYSGIGCNRAFCSSHSVNSRWAGWRNIGLNHILPAPKSFLKFTAWAPLPHFASAPSPPPVHSHPRPLQHGWDAASADLGLATRNNRNNIFPTLQAGLRALCLSPHCGTRRSRAKAETLMLAVLRVTLFNLLSGAKAKFPKLRSATALQSPLLLIKGVTKATQRRGWWDNVSTDLFHTAEAVHRFLLFCVCAWLLFFS